MKPNASLKSRKVNCRVMASRFFASLQRGSLASALLRAFPVSFSAMVATSRASIVPRIALREPLAKPVAALTLHESPPVDPASRTINGSPLRRLLLLPGGPDVLVTQYRHDCRNGGPRPRDLPVVSGPDFRRQLGRRRAVDGVARARLHGAPVRLRGGARVRAHLHGARVRRVDTRRHAAADRRRCPARAHPRGA